MGRYEHTIPTTPFLISIFLLFCFCPIVLSQLSQNQKNTMTTLSHLLFNGSLPWNSGSDSNPCIAWKGVFCDNNKSNVIKITLSGYSLSNSSFLPVLCQIETLEHLDVSNNQLSSIPDEFMTQCGKLKGLKLLNFTENYLVALPAFHGFHALESLDMSFNHLGGSIDLELDELVSLKSLNFSSNRFTGTLPTKLGKSKALEQLMLSVNNFEGEIPEEILNYENLSSIDLSENKLSGTIPADIGKLSKLESLILSSNTLGGPIPTSLMNIITLLRFAANQNHFSGSVPQGITKHLTSLDLSYNRLSGPIPKDLLSPLKLQHVDLSYNDRLSGSLPQSISPSIVRLRLGGNVLSESIPSDAFANATNLTYLEVESNNLTGVIPDTLGNCKSLALLNLANNSLSGMLPPELGNLGSLQVLNLQMNKLAGTIPIQIGQLWKLSKLNLSWNSLGGSIPNEISGLSNLTFLNLRQNNLIGSIPDSIGNLRDLIELQLGGNQLMGMIPRMPVSLQSTLNLSSNQFSGSIPVSLGNLDHLEVLDLSNNNFSGHIPESLTSMSALTRLLVSYNHLFGVIPNFAKHVDVESQGPNNHLVPPPTQDNRPANLSPRSAKKGASVAVAVLIAIAAAIFLVGLVTVLVVSISRHYYRVNDEHLQSGEGLGPPHVIQSNLLTSNRLHRSNIDFSKAMEAVADTSNVTLKTRFSTYYKAIMPSGSTYFVKKLNWTDKTLLVGSDNRFGKELEVLAKLNNSNVMTPLAYVLSTDGAYILYEFISNGSVFDVLHGSVKKSLDWSSRYSIAVGVAQGLSFLHGFASSPILLLDLSSKSIMLKSLKEPLVGDIEHYKVIDPSKSTGNFSAVAGSVGYIPPEYAYTMTVTMAGNVYSFGIILLELLTGKPAMTEGTELVKWVMRNSANKDYILDFNVSRTSQAVRSQMLTILQIALCCVSTSPETRPKMKSVLRMLLNAR